MVDIILPIEINVGDTPTTVEVIGVCISYTDTPLQIVSKLENSINELRSLIQFKDRKNEPPVYVDVSVGSKEQFMIFFTNIFTNDYFQSNTSVENLHLIEHLSAGLAAELSRQLGLNAIGSLCEIESPENVYKGIAENMYKALTDSELLRNYLYEQLFAKSPERFFPGKDDTYKPLPFEPGDRLSFYLQLKFENSRINNVMTFHTWKNAYIPSVKFIVEFHFES